MNNINTMQAAQTENQWEAPVLYKEEWANTLTSDQPGIENTTTSFS